MTKIVCTPDGYWHVRNDMSDEDIRMWMNNLPPPDMRFDHTIMMYGVVGESTCDCGILELPHLIPEADG